MAVKALATVTRPAKAAQSRHFATLGFRALLDCQGLIRPDPSNYLGRSTAVRSDVAWNVRWVQLRVLRARDGNMVAVRGKYNKKVEQFRGYSNSLLSCEES